MKGERKKERKEGRKQLFSLRKEYSLSYKKRPKGKTGPLGSHDKKRHRRKAGSLVLGNSYVLGTNISWSRHLLIVVNDQIHVTADEGDDIGAEWTHYSLEELKDCGSQWEISDDD